ncbi:MAG: amidohydrolase family protein [Steroidobacteraceae bacterium]
MAAVSGDADRSAGPRVGRQSENLRGRCGTINGAYSMFEEHLKGSIQPGRLADLVVWDRDMFEVEPSELSRINPERTMIGGRWAYEA